MGKGRCAVCGKEHDELEPAFFRPDAVFAVPEEEREARIKQSDDFVSVDDQAFFIRCVAPLPVKGRGPTYDWGFWVKVARAHFEEYRRFFSVDPPADHPGFTGTLANQTRLLPPTLGLPVHVHLGRGRDRPRIMLLDERHMLTQQQERGLTEPEVHAWSELCQTDDTRLDPPAPLFQASLEQQGWRVADAAEVGREPERRAPPPGAGDVVKAAFAFLASDPHGQVSRRVELMWVLLDEVRADGWWSGTLNDRPFVPGAIDRGTRVWLRAEQAIALQPGEPAG
jgi:hypothetical protein